MAPRRWGCEAVHPDSKPSSPDEVGPDDPAGVYTSNGLDVPSRHALILTPWKTSSGHWPPKQATPVGAEEPRGPGTSSCRTIAAALEEAEEEQPLNRNGVTAQLAVELSWLSPLVKARCCSLLINHASSCAHDMEMWFDEKASQKLPKENCQSWKWILEKLWWRPSCQLQFSPTNGRVESNRPNSKLPLAFGLGLILRLNISEPFLRSHFQGNHLPVVAQLLVDSLNSPCTKLKKKNRKRK